MTATAPCAGAPQLGTAASSCGSGSGTSVDRCLVAPVLRTLPGAEAA